MAGVNRMCQWATPDMDQATALAQMAMYEKAEPYLLDVMGGAWKRHPEAEQSIDGPGGHDGHRREEQ